MIKNLRLLIILHLVLGLLSIIVYVARPETLAHTGGHARGATIALATLLKVILALLPYFISGFYSCNVLASRDPRATIAFSCLATGISLVAAGVHLNLLRMNTAPAALLVFGAVTVALLASARACAAIWARDVSGWDSNR